MKITIVGAKKYWYYQGLVGFVAKIAGWDEIKTREFLSKNELVYFPNRDAGFAKELIDNLSSSGFELSIEESKNELRITLALPSEREIEGLKLEVESISKRLTEIQATGKEPAKSSVQGSVVYQRIAQAAESVKEPQKVQTSASQMARTSTFKENVTESFIGKYWLSRMGVLSLVLGVVFFLGYSFQYLGAFGKIMVGLSVGVVLVVLGHLLTRKEEFFKWAMGILSGGWAILYFAVFAAYHIPATKIIDQPIIAFSCLMFVAAASIWQSFRYRSPLFVFFSYFLAYVAMASSGVTVYTLVASLLLGVSAVIVTKRFGWNWLALLSCAALYITHWFWIEPSIYGFLGNFSGQEKFSEALFLPFAGDEWRLYPLIDTSKSFLHQGFLIAYWLLFVTLGFFRKSKDDESDPQNEQLSFFLLLANSVIFSASYIHHLHVYYPGFKYIFVLVMALLFACLAYVKERLGKSILSDLYLAFSVSMFSLAIPMYFDGPYVTYGWSAGAVVLTWLGLKHNRLILRRCAWVLSIFTVCHLFLYDYAEKSVLFTFWDPVQLTSLIFIVPSLAFFLIFLVYHWTNRASEREIRIAQNSYLIGSLCTLTSGITIGGPQVIASLVGIISSGLLAFYGLKLERKSLRMAFILFFVLSICRLIAVDTDFDISKFLRDPYITFRLFVGALAIISSFACVEWLRRTVKNEDEIEPWIFPTASFLTAAVILDFFYQGALNAWISLIWAFFATMFVIGGFVAKEKIYRWSGLGMFAFVLLRLFLHDFAQLETLFKIFSFMGLGIILIVVSLIYSSYAKQISEKKE